MLTDFVWLTHMINLLCSKKITISHSSDQIQLNVRGSLWMGRWMVTDPTKILEQFRSYFEDLSSSKPSSNSLFDAAADLALRLSKL